MMAALRFVAMPLVADCMREEQAIRKSRLIKDMAVVVLFAFKIRGTGRFLKRGL